MKIHPHKISNKATFLKNCIALVLLLQLVPFITNAQTGNFMMSSVGTIEGTNSNSLAVQFKSTTSCIDVQTGILVLYGNRGNGEFAINCEVTMKLNSLGIRLFPNPVNTLTKIKFTNTPPLLAQFTLSIYTTEGILIKISKESGYNLFQGLNIDLSFLNAGTYFLNITSTEYIDTIKFIKS